MSRSKILRVLTPATLVLAFVVTGFGQFSTTSTVGVGWGASTPPPELVSTRPIIGQTTLMFGHNLQPGATCWFAVSPPPVSSTHLGHGFHIQTGLDAILYGPVVSDALGTMFFPVLLDLPPQVAGEKAVLQVFIQHPSSIPDFIDLEITNGLNWTFGVQ